MLIVKPCLNIIKNRQLREKTNILECSCNPCFTYINSRFSCNIHIIKKNFTTVRFVNSCKKVKNSSFSGTVRPDKAIKLLFFVLILNSFTARRPPNEIPRFFTLNKSSIILKPPFSSSQRKDIFHAIQLP